jgi:dTDP-6-deoxy-L-talose 4-dehydrogenase (NAD+)
VNFAVTGASGFVGRHVLSALEQRGIDAVAASRAQVPTAARSAKFDLHDPPEDVFELLGRPDTLIHLAWSGLPNYRSPHHVEQELPAQHRFLEQMVAAGVRNVVVAGTCLEYGMQSGALDEGRPTQPTTAYGAAKDTLRKQLQTLQAQVPFALTWARLFYVYGDGQAATSLLSQLKAAVQRGDAVFNMSGGEQLRDYLPIEEAAAALARLACTGRDNGVVNVCSGAPITVASLVRRWIEANGWSIRLNLGYYPYPDYEPMAFWGDCRKLAACVATSP